MVIPPEMVEAFVQMSKMTAKREMGGKRQFSQTAPSSDGDKPASKFLRALDGSAVEVAAGVESSASGAGANTDPLSTLAEEFERYVTSAPLPDAFNAAAAAAGHGHDILPFDDARMFAHYVSCPPPRVRHLKEAKEARDALLSAGAGAAGAAALAAPTQAGTDTDTGTGPGERPGEGQGTAAARTGMGAVQFESLAFETSILEPEAAVYVAERARPGSFVVTRRDGDSSGNTGAASQPLSSLDLWHSFCGSVHNFPARYAVYAACRDAGWVVRDGHGFGCDFVLYSRGPGAGHSRLCIVVMPLRLIGPPADAAAPPSAPSSMPTLAHNLPVPYIRLPADPSVSGTWLSTHAHARVMTTVRKSLVHAYVTLRLPFAQPTAPVSSAPGMEQGFYPPAIASLMSHPTFIAPRPHNNNSGPAGETPQPAPTVTVDFTYMSRWLLAMDHKDKNATAAARLALAAAEAGLDLEWEESEAEEGMRDGEEGAQGEGGGHPSTGLGAQAVKAKGLNKQQKLTKMKQVLARSAKEQQQQLASGRGDTGGTGTSNSASSLQSWQRQQGAASLLPASSAGTSTDASAEQQQSVQVLDLSSLLPVLLARSAQSTATTSVSTEPEAIEADPRSEGEGHDEHAAALQEHDVLLQRAASALHTGAVPPHAAAACDVPAPCTTWYVDRGSWTKNGGGKKAR